MSKRRLAELEKALKRAREVLALCTPRVPEDDCHAPEDPAVLALCLRHGFGAVMHSAARQWARIDELDGLPVYGDLSAFTCGPCRATVRKVLVDIDTLGGETGPAADGEAV